MNLRTIDPVSDLPRLRQMAARAVAARPTAQCVRDDHVLDVLATHAGNVSRAAHALGLHRRTLQRWLKHMNGGDYRRIPTLACSAGALHLIEQEQERRELSSRAHALDAILAEWQAARDIN